MSETTGSARRMRPMSFIGEGAGGEVFVGMDEVLRRRVVVKKLLSRSFASEEARWQLIQEARTLARLDHPHILRIHHYTEDLGYDIFTFEFASGRTLGTALQEGLDFAKKVRIASAVASALVVAHRHGLVHGALSPESILLADNGDIKLTNFASTTTRLEGARAEARWMSPEQTRGEEPTSTSDMYSFGLVLRELFGDGDRDVRALVGSLVCEIPSERSTATEALARLERLASRRARYIRIAAVAVVGLLLIGGAVKYLFDLQRERSAAIAARAEAEQLRAEANDLAGFMIRDLRPKLWSVGRLDILDATTEKGLAYFASMNPAEISPREAAVNVEALVLFGETQIARADLAGAHDTLGKAIALADATLRRHPNDLEVRFAAGDAQVMMSNERESSGDVPGALRHALASAAVFNDLVQRAPHEVRFLRRQAWAYSNLGTLYDRTEDAPSNLASLEKAIAVKREIIRLENTIENGFDAGITVHKAGLALLKLGRFQEAQGRLEEERARLELLLKRESTHRRMRQLLAVLDDDLTAVAFATGDMPRALQRSASDLDTSTQLASFDPDNIQWKLLRVVAHRGSGTAARMNGDVAAALRHHESAVDELSGVFARGKQNSQVVRDMALSRIELARSLIADKRAHAAEIQARLTLDLLRPIRSELPVQRMLGDALLVQGEAMSAQGNDAQATAAWEEALGVVTPLDARSPDPRVADTHARILLRLGRRDEAIPLVEELSALGYRNREFEALCNEKSASVKP